MSSFESLECKWLINPAVYCLCLGKDLLSPSSFPCATDSLHPDKIRLMAVLLRSVSVSRVVSNRQCKKRSPNAAMLRAYTRSVIPIIIPKVTFENDADTPFLYLASSEPSNISLSSPYTFASCWGVDSRRSVPSLTMTHLFCKNGIRCDPCRLPLTSPVNLLSGLVWCSSAHRSSHIVDLPLEGAPTKYIQRGSPSNFTEVWKAKHTAKQSSND